MDYLTKVVEELRDEGVEITIDMKHVDQKGWALKLLDPDGYILHDGFGEVFFRVSERSSPEEALSEMNLKLEHSYNALLLSISSMRP